MGGTSTSSNDFVGRSALYCGWASWDLSRNDLPRLQTFHDRHAATIQVVTIAFDVQGPEHPMRYLRAAGYTFTALIDATCELSRLWGMKSLPFAVLVDADGVVRASLDRWDDAFLAETPKLIAKKAPKPLPDVPVDRTSTQFEILLQSCTNLLSRARKEDANVSLQKALELDPENRLVRKQMWAIAHPERFYSGAIDLDWQKVQEDSSRHLRLPKKR